MYFSGEKVAFVHYLTSNLFRTDRNSTLIGDAVLSAQISGKNITNTPGAVTYRIEVRK